MSCSEGDQMATCINRAILIDRTGREAAETAQYIKVNARPARQRETKSAITLSHHPIIEELGVAGDVGTVTPVVDRYC